MRTRHWIWAGLALWAAALGWTTLAMQRAGTPEHAEPVKLTTSVPAAALTGVHVEAPAGAVEIVAATGDTVNISVDVRHSSSPRRFGPPSSGPQSASLDQRTEDGVLRLRLSGVSAGGLDETWTVSVPPRLFARVDLKKGPIRVRGVEGGVSAKSGSGVGSRPGEIRVEVPRGALDLSMGVGDIHAVTTAAAHGPVDVASDVGDASLFLDGHEIVAPHEPGPGHRLRLSGDRGDTLKLRVGVGDATLRIR